MALTFEPPAPSPDPDLPENRFAMQALERHKREGMELAVRARTIAMVVIGVMIGVLTPWPQAIYYIAINGLFVLIGLAQRRIGRVGTSKSELGLLFCDLALMTIVAAVPNPWAIQSMPLPFQFQFDIHKYYFVLLAMATLTYSWRTIIAVGTWTTVLWAIAVFGIWYLSVADPEVTATLVALYPDNAFMADFMNPTYVMVEQRIQEAVVFLICAVILGITVRRFHTLLLAQGEVERERANLARYFSPNVVDQLSHNDEPLKKVSTQDIAVLFVDIVGFTGYSATRDPQDVITTLRAFHGLMETEVFRHHGTLDKYLGDGLMATFGTPVAGPSDAANALSCARAMVEAIERWNATRLAAGEPEIAASFGVHFGPAVLGDIGANRLEFAVIGNTVNVASRLEAMTRDLGVRLIVSDDLLNSATADHDQPLGLVRHENQSVRGLETGITVWTLT